MGSKTTKHWTELEDGVYPLENGRFVKRTDNYGRVWLNYISTEWDKLYPEEPKPVYPKTLRILLEDGEILWERPNGK